MQDGKKKKTKKPRLNKAQVIELLAKKYNIRVKTTDERLENAVNSMEERYKEPLFSLLKKYRKRKLSVEDEITRDKYLSTLLSKGATTAKFADQDKRKGEKGSKDLFDFLDHAFSKNACFFPHYPRMIGDLPAMFGTFRKKGCYTWLEILAEQISMRVPTKMREEYARTSIHVLTRYCVNWQEIMAVMHADKEMRGREPYFIKLAAVSEEKEAEEKIKFAKEFVDNAQKVSLKTYQRLYEIRNESMSRQEPEKKEKIVAEKLTDLVNNIAPFDSKVQEKVAEHTKNILFAGDAREIERIDPINEAIAEIDDVQKLVPAIEYAARFRRRWRFDKLLHAYLNHIPGIAAQKTSADEFKRYLSYLLIAFGHKTRAEKEKRSYVNLFHDTKNALENIFGLQRQDKQEVFSAGDAFLENGLHLVRNGGQDLAEFLDNYASLCQITKKQGKFLKEFIDHLLQNAMTSNDRELRRHLTTLSNQLSLLADEFSKENFQAWVNALEKKMDTQKPGQSSLSSYILQSASLYAQADEETIEHASNIRDLAIELRKPYQERDDVLRQLIVRKLPGKLNYMPDEFLDADLVFLRARAQAGDDVENDVLFDFCGFFCYYLNVVRPETIMSAAKIKQPDLLLYSFLRKFQQIPKENQRFFMDELNQMFAPYVEKTRMILKKQDSTLREKEKYEARWREFREKLEQLIDNYFDNLPKMIDSFGVETAQAWAEEGAKLDSVDAAVKFYGRRSYTSSISVDKFLQGLKFDDVVGKLKVYAEALSNKRLAVEKTDSVELKSSLQEGKIVLPISVHAFEDDEQNFSIYKVLTSYQTAFLEFGTYEIDESALKELIQDCMEKSGSKEEIDEVSLARLMSTYPNSEAAKFIFTMLETARVKSKLLETYPGLRNDMAIFDEYISSNFNKPKSSFEALYQICMTGSSKRKSKLAAKLKSEIDEHIRMPSATVIDSLHLTDRLYDIMKADEVAKRVEPPEPVSEINLEEAVTVESGLAPKEEEILLDEQEGKPILFPEWDADTGQLKENYVLVYERPIEVVENDFVTSVLDEDYVHLERIRREFERLKPEERKALKKQLSGEPDFNAIVEAKGQIAAGVTPSEKLFIRTYKNQRSVATLLLTEVSGSLRKFLDLDNPRKGRFIDISKKTCLYMCEAIDQTGDAYSIIAYSGKTREQVDVYQIKGFNEKYNRETQRRIGSLKALQQNRDGAGIRYATHVLSRRPEKHKILAYLLEGAPNDIEYKGEYAIADTREALREARNAGLHPIVIFTGDAEKEVMEKIARGFRFAHVNRMEDVPAKLPGIYRRLTG